MAKNKKPTNRSYVLFYARISDQWIEVSPNMSMLLASVGIKIKEKYFKVPK